MGRAPRRGQTRGVPPPSGTVTLLFTDMVASTAAWDRDPELKASSVERHDAVLRDAIERHGGYVFKTVGDALCAAFATAQAAVTAAVAGQRAIAAERWAVPGGIAVRMGLHSGACQERDGDYFGAVVNRVVRLEAVAHGGQIVVS